MAKELGRKEWLRAARLALLRGGPDKVRVEPLARDLRVTKGSFYWHFKDREELLELLLREWEVEFPQMISQVRGLPGREAFESLLRLVVEQAPLGEDGRSPSDAAMYTWAAVSPAVARRVNRTEKKRLRLLKQIVGDANVTEVLYLIWLGFVARGQRLPQSRDRFPQIAQTILKLFTPKKSKARVRPA